ncbi:hypothetical protein JD844_003965 [Phrynosoma platyrhinos]|uniref:L27 domain-containing protein n=1 Tax=Phrynosoma platyrhinos TaxID=52577 RepID=A0ABQ7TMU2_PHRPL|nr:hypothetical protein JD844_003965 [Phrynosoma platyrhinos]
MADTRRAAEILARYQGALRSPAEQPLQISIEKVLHIFQSELFQALLDIQECYELSLLSICKKDGRPSLEDAPLPKTQDNAGPKGCPENQDHNPQALQPSPLVAFVPKVPYTPKSVTAADATGGQCES